MAEGTAALRGAAARWSLAGDQQLLDLLQDIHQRIISRCNETNKKLEEMSRGLRDASVNLQNVNNKFLALSNTQFVESRVYDDDADVAAPAGGEKAPPKVADLSSDLAKLKQSLQRLEGYHEPLLIVGDSDDSDSDGDDDRLVLKPKDLYADRPLPYIIGSQAWRSKWHAGLVPDESDSDSSTSKVEDAEMYSDSEEETRPDETQHCMPARKMSSDSSSLQSAEPASPPRPAPAAVAAELARRLGGDVKIPEREPVYTEPEAVVRKLYKPQEPIATTIFPDEPPPLDGASSDDDIFAELHKTQPKSLGNRVDDLFDFTPKPSEMEEALFGAPKVQPNHSIDKPPLFAEDHEPEVTETPRSTDKEQPGDGVKKPVGGISLFGTNKHAESIGAAILKRNRRKSSTSGDESNTEEVKVVKEVNPVKEVKKERDIFDDLFAKSEKLNKKNVKTEAVQPRNVVQPKEIKKDAFSDIFDDIDDIFSSDIVNVKIKETKKNEKLLFSDDDDLFAEISKVNKDEKDEVKAKEKSDLFSNVTLKVEKVQPKQKVQLASITPRDEKREVKKENKVLNEIKETKGLFDSDSDDGLFTNVTKNVKQNITETEKAVEYKLKDDLFNDGDDNGLFATLHTNTRSKRKDEVIKNVCKDVGDSKTPLFDSDEELFRHTKTVKQPHHTNQSNNAVQNIKANNDQLFVTPINKAEVETDIPDAIKEVKIESDRMLNTKEVRNNSITVIDSINNDLFDDKVSPKYPKASPFESSHDSFNDEEPYTNKSFSKNDSNENKDSSVNKAMAKGLDRLGRKGLAKDFQDTKSSAPISDDIYGKPNEQTYFKENILRTTRIGSEEESIPTKIQTRDNVNDSDDDFFRSTTKTFKDSEGNRQTDGVPEPANLPETPDLFAEPTNKNDIFSDVFNDVPPIFEKPKEPKKSKNVNALFDDDSDDESLFFKKNDVITDEKPAFSPSGEIFGIFNDEPPAIDVDFIQKSSKNEDILQNSHKTDDILPAFDKIDHLTSQSVKAYDSITEKSDQNTDAVISRETEDTTDNTSTETKKIGKLKPMNFNINVNTLLPGASPKKKQIQNIDGQTASNEELHKADKIEPKIVKSISFDDPEILDNKISKERAKIQVKRRPSTRRARREAVRKSEIDFTDSSFDSSNDNSTKEKVKEKVVKTVYILNDDDIFGTTKTQSESTEHTKKHLNIVDSDEELFKNLKKNTDKNDNVNLTNDLTHLQQATVERKSSFDSNDNDDLFKKPTRKVAKDEIDATDYKDVQNKVKTGLDTNENNLFKVDNVEDTNRKNPSKEDVFSKETENKSFLDSEDGDDLFRQTHKKSLIVEDRINEPNLDSDEELFRHAPKNQDYKVKTTRSFLSSDDDDDLFKTKSTKEIIKPVLKSNVSSDEEEFKNKGIGTLGKVYKSQDNTDAKETNNIFDDFPAKTSTKDGNLNPDKVAQGKVANTTIKEQIVDKTVEETKPTVKRSILDDLSDEDDLFKSKTKLLSKNDKSLFGDDGDDDDDLFGSKTAKEVKQDIPVALPTKEPKAAEPVFVDPLSLFGDEE